MYNFYLILKKINSFSWNFPVDIIRKALNCEYPYVYDNDW